MDKFMEKIKGTKILGIIGNLILAVAVFLPVLTVSVSYLVYHKVNQFHISKVMEYLF